MFVTKVLFAIIIASQFNKTISFLPICNNDTLSLTLQSGISFLPEIVFDHCLNLLEINFSNNKIPNIPEKVFWLNRKVERLFLSNNLIDELSDNVFKNLANLIHLDLSYNNITYFYFQSLMNTKVRFLNLAHNNIVNIEYDTICYLPFLR